jgi:hypothetical protein
MFSSLEKQDADSHDLPDQVNQANQRPIFFVVMRFVICRFLFAVGSAQHQFAPVLRVRGQLQVLSPEGRPSFQIIGR